MMDIENFNVVDAFIQYFVYYLEKTVNQTYLLNLIIDFSIITNTNIIHRCQYIWSRKWKPLIENN